MDRPLPRVCGLRSIELYDPENPSIDDLCPESDHSSGNELDKSEVSVQRCGRQLSDTEANRSVDTIGEGVFSEFVENSRANDYESSLTYAENSGCSQKIYDSDKAGRTPVPFCQTTSTFVDKQEYLYTSAEKGEQSKPITLSKPAIKWKATKKTVPFPALIADNDMTSLNCISDSFQLDLPVDESSTAMFDLGSRGVSVVLQSNASNKIHAADINCDNISDETQNSNSKSGSALHAGKTDSVAEIDEPAESYDDVAVELSYLPRIIKLSRVEDPSEPDEGLPASDQDLNTATVGCPRVIRLDRDEHVEPSPIGLLCEDSDPLEPIDNEPYDNPVNGNIPREIKLDRIVDDEMFESFPSCSEPDTQLLIKPRIVQLNMQPVKVKHNYFDALHVDKTNVIGVPVEVKTPNEVLYCQDTPLSPIESIESVSDDDSAACQPFPLKPVLTEKLDYCCDLAADENSVTLSEYNGGKMKPKQAGSSTQSLSDGEIVDEDEGEFGIFQVPGGVDRKEKLEIEDHKKKSKSKGHYEDLVADAIDASLHQDRKPSRCIKLSKLKTDACVSMSSSSCFLSECTFSDKSVKEKVEIQNHKKKSGSKRHYEDHVDDTSLHQESRSTKWPKLNTDPSVSVSSSTSFMSEINECSNKPVRMSTSMHYIPGDNGKAPAELPTIEEQKEKKCKPECASKSSNSLISKPSDKVVRISTFEHHSTDDKHKSPVELPSIKERKHKKHKREHTSRSPEMLFVGNNKTTKRRVVVVSNKVSELEEGCHEHHVSPVADGTSHTRQKRKFKNRNLHERKSTSERQQRCRKLKSESHGHKHKRKHKRHKHRKQRFYSDGSVDDVEQRHTRSRSRSYDRIVEMIRMEKQQEPATRRLRSVVVPKNNVASAPQQYLTDGSCNNLDSSGDSAVVFRNDNILDLTDESIPDSQLHLCRLSYSGELEHDGVTTLLGECMKSKYGPDYDSHYLSKSLAYLCHSAENSNHDIEVVGVSYSGKKQLKNDKVTDVATCVECVSSESVDDGGDDDKKENAVSLDHHVSVEDLQPLAETQNVEAGEMSATGKHLLNKVTDTDKIESKKVMVLSKEVQTQVSLFTEIDDHISDSCVSLDGNKSKPCSDANKEDTVVDTVLHASDFGDAKECIRSPSPIPSDSCNTALSDLPEAVPSIQSPECCGSDTACTPRLVSLERTDVSKPTHDSPKQNCEDLYVTVPNVSESHAVMPVTKTIALERLPDSGDDFIPQVTVADTSITISQTTEQCKVSAAAVTSTEMNGTVDGTFVLNNDSVGAVANVCSKKHEEEQFELLNHTTVAAVHHLPPTVEQKPVSTQRAMPVPLSRKLTATSNGHRSTFSVSGNSTMQQVCDLGVSVSCCDKLQPLFISPSVSAVASNATSVEGVVLPSSVSLQSQLQNETQETIQQLPESLSFFNQKSVQIPGICEDVPDSRRHESKNGASLSAHQKDLLLKSGSLSVINVVVTTTVASESEICDLPVVSRLPMTAEMSSAFQQTGRPLPHYVTSSQVGSSSNVASVASHLLCSTGCENSSAERDLMPCPTVVTSDHSVAKPSVASALMPLLKALASSVLKQPIQQHTTLVSGSANVVSSNGSVSAVSGGSSSLTVPAAVNCATTTLTSTDAVCAWITSLPLTTAPKKPQSSGQPLPKVTEELDFDVDAVESPRSDEIMSFSPPSSEHMMAIIKMKHPVGIRRKASKKTYGHEKQPKAEMKETDKTEMLKRVSHQFKLIMQPYYKSGKITKDEYKDIMRKAVPSICHSRSRDTSQVKMVRYADAYVHKVLMMRKYLAKKNSLSSQNSS